MLLWMNGLVNCLQTSKNRNVYVGSIPTESSMKILEKSRLKLREYILANKEQVLLDLKEMKSKSEGNDIFKYLDNMSKK